MPAVGSRLKGRTIACVAALGGGIAAICALGAIVGLPDIGALVPIDLAVRPSILVDRRLAALQRDRALCRRVLIAPFVTAAEIADVPLKDGCGWTNNVRIRSAGNARLAVDSVSCELAAALALWLAHEVQPSALARLGAPLAAVRHRGSYACRNIRGSPRHAHRRSEHARANALDIAGFQLQDGRRIDVRAHWHSNGPEAEFLHEIHARACRYFRVAIGPDFNAAHKDHLHYDRGTAHACR